MTDAATPNADQTQPNDQTTANRTAGEPLDAGVGLTQGQIDAIVQARLAEQERRLQAKYGNFEELAKKAAAYDQHEAAQLTELEKLQKQLAEKDAAIEVAKQQAESERLAALRLRVGQELGLPPQLSALLQGADEDAIRAHANTLISVMPAASQGVQVPNLNATAGGGTPTTRRGVKLSPEQEQAIINAQKVDPTLTRERYIERLREFQEKD